MAKGSHETLKENMVITIEPGIYMEVLVGTDILTRLL
ncbi:M24 family metallopeptidase [Pseudogracilibacillus auburnensis]